MSKSKIYRRERTKWLIPLRRFENNINADLRALFDGETDYIIGNYNNISDNGFSILRKLDLEANVREILERHVNKIIVFSARTTQESIDKLVKKQDNFEYIEYINEYVASQVFAQSIESIATTYYDDISRIIASGVASELTRVEIAKTIADKIPNITKYRSKTIAITETHRASSYASERRAKDIQADSGLVMFKDWIPVSDGRTRQSHRAMASVKPIPLNDMFTVGGEKMSRPNDPNASAANTIRCRCVMRYIVKE